MLIFIISAPHYSYYLQVRKWKSKEFWSINTAISRNYSINYNIREFQLWIIEHFNFFLLPINRNLRMFNNYFFEIFECTMIYVICKIVCTFACIRWRARNDLYTDSDYTRRLLNPLELLINSEPVRLDFRGHLKASIKYIPSSINHVMNLNESTKISHSSRPFFENFEYRWFILEK